jgi:cytoskeletal protein RodZ
VNSTPSDEHGDSQPVGADSLGRLLRRAREGRGLSLREISDQTRISRRYLEAIEAEEFKHLPGGIFNRSFVKSFARAVGVPEERALELYARALRERGEMTTDDAPTSRQASRIYTDDAPSRSPLLTAALSLLILAVISLGVYAWLHYYKRTADAPATPQADSGRPAAGDSVAGPPASPGQAQPAATQQQQTTTPAGALSVSVRARGEDVWLRSKVDDADSSDGILKAEEARDFAAAGSLKLRYAKVKARALEVTINGRAAVVPTETVRGTNFVEMLITKDDYERLLRQP